MTTNQNAHRAVHKVMYHTLTLAVVRPVCLAAWLIGERAV